jgi:hypothetical protein
MRTKLSVLLGVAAMLTVALPASSSGRSNTVGAAPGSAVADWTQNAHQAIATATRFPAKEAVYMGIVSATIYDAAVAVDGRYRPYGNVDVTAPRGASLDAAVAAAANDVLVGLFPAQQVQLDNLYNAYVNGVAAGQAKDDGLAAGHAVAGQILASPRIATAISVLRAPEHYQQQTPGPGVYEPTGPAPIGTTLADVPPLALASVAQFRPDGPSTLGSEVYAHDLNEVALVGRKDSTARTAEQTTTAWFWTDLDIPQWNRAMLRLADSRGLGPLQTARMLAMANVSGSDAMIACFDAKYQYFFWRPVKAIRNADTDGNPATNADPTWEPLFPTPPFPEYPSAHGCHSAAVTQALRRFFGTDRVRFSLDSFATTPPPAGCTACAPGAVRYYDRFRDAVKEVISARVWAGFHFRHSDQAGAALGRKVARYVTQRFFEQRAKRAGRG